MGQCSSTPSEDAGAGFASACQVFLTATKPVPVVGEVAKVLLEVAKKYGEISETLVEAEQVKAWAYTQARTFKDLEARTSDSSKEIDEVLRGQLEDVARSIGELLKIAEKIKRGCFLTKRIKAGVFQGKFNSAKNAVERARVELDRTLTIKIADTVHRIEDTGNRVEVEVGGLRDDVKRILAKIEQNGDANERQLQRGLVISVKDQPELLPVAEMVVDGDGAGASAALAAAPAEVRESAAAKYAEGVALLQQEEWSEAIAAFQNCVALNANHSEAWFALGRAYYDQNGMKPCEASYAPYTRCIALDNTHVGAHVNLGHLLKNVRKDYDGAERHYRKAIELDPSDGDYYYNLGSLLQTVRKDYDGAEKLFRKAIELDPSDAMAHNHLGWLLHDVRKDYDGAEKLYRKAIELDPSDASAHNHLGRLIYDQKDYVKAEEMYRKAIELEPTCAHAHDNLGTLLNARKDYDGAKQHYRKAIELDPSGGAYHNNLADLLMKGGDLGEAEKKIREAIKIDPQDAVYHSTYGEILEAKSNIPGAIEEAEEFVRLGGIRGNDGKEYLAKLLRRRAKLEASTQ